MGRDWSPCRLRRSPPARSHSPGRNYLVAPEPTAPSARSLYRAYLLAALGAILARSAELAGPRGVRAYISIPCLPPALRGLSNEDLENMIETCRDCNLSGGFACEQSKYLCEGLDHCRLKK
jgi:hypothetical protein